MTDLKVLIPRQDIAKRVAELGAEITSDFTGQSVIFVGVLKGAAIFLADLSRQVRPRLDFRFHRRLQLWQPSQPHAGTQERMGLHRRSEADQGRGPNAEGQKHHPGRRHSRHWADLTYLKKMLLARQPRTLKSRRASRQAFAAQASAAGRLRWLQDSRRVCGRLWAGLCGTIPQPRRHLRRAAGIVPRECAARTSRQIRAAPALPPHQRGNSKTRAGALSSGNPAAIIETMGSVLSKPDRFADRVAAARSRGRARDLARPGHDPAPRRRSRAQSHRLRNICDPAAQRKNSGTAIPFSGGISARNR